MLSILTASLTAGSHQWVWELLRQHTPTTLQLQPNAMNISQSTTNYWDFEYPGHSGASWVIIRVTGYQNHLGVALQQRQQQQQQCRYRTRSTWIIGPPPTQGHGWSSANDGCWNFFWQGTLPGLTSRPSQYNWLCQVELASSPTNGGNTLPRGEHLNVMAASPMIWPQSPSSNCGLGCPVAKCTCGHSSVWT